MNIASQPEHADTPKARRYNRIRRRLALLDIGLSFTALVVLLATGWTLDLRDIAYQMAGQGYILALFLYVLMLAMLGKVLGFGLDYYGFRLERRFRLSNQKLRSWLWDEAKGWLLGLLFGVVLAEFVYNIMRLAPEHWWVIAWAVFLALFVLIAQLAPVLLFSIFYKFEPLRNEELRQRLVRLCERADTRVRGVYEWKLSEKSKKANAALTGLGATRRIILSDTLLESYSDDEIEAVLAHELGHHVHRHIPRSIAVQAAMSFLGFWLANQVLRMTVEQPRVFPGVLNFDRVSDFANLPLLVLISSALSLLLVPVLNAWSRRNERQADRYCWDAIPTVEPFISSMNKLADQNLAERSPSRLVEWLFHSHPPISKRIAAAQAFARTHRTTTE